MLKLGLFSSIFGSAALFGVASIKVGDDTFYHHGKSENGADIFSNGSFMSLFYGGQTVHVPNNESIKKNEITHQKKMKIHINNLKNKIEEMKLKLEKTENENQKKELIWKIQVEEHHLGKLTGDSLKNFSQT